MKGYKMSKMDDDDHKYDQDKGLLICHCCARFRCQSKTDMRRHYKKKNPCKIIYKTKLSRQELYLASINKQYFFKDIDYIFLSEDDYIFIINNYCSEHNTIDMSYRSMSNVLQNLVDTNIENIKKDTELFNDIFSEYSDLKTSDKINATVGNHEDEEEKIQQNQCQNCRRIFSTYSSLVRHLKRKKTCENNRLVYETIHTQTHKKLESIISKGQSAPIIVNGGNLIIGDVTLTQNNQNTQNNIQSTTKIEVRDFVHDIYDHSHLDYTELSRDFFLLGNFLNLLMENKANHNIILMESDLSNAVVFTRNDLRKMPSDKMGFIMIEKLYQTMENMIFKLCHSEAHRKEMHYLSRYYKVIMDKYRWDTTYREYDVENKSFYSTSQGRQLRCRDEYLADIIRVLNKHRPQIKEDLFQSASPESMEEQYLPINPNIEDFCSVRARYRDMKS